MRLAFKKNTSRKQQNSNALSGQARACQTAQQKFEFFKHFARILISGLIKNKEQ
jgi:hypothetical protein